MGRAPKRASQVYLAGAGLSSAFGLPNTQELLQRVHTLCAQGGYFGSTRGLNDRLDAAYKAIYPVESQHLRGFRPNVVDFFSVLKAYSEISGGLPDVPLDRPGELLQDLKRAIACILVSELRDMESRLKSRHAYLDRMLERGNFVITTNWDLLIERYAALHEIPIRYSIGSKPRREVTLIKLHGSIDWALQGDTIHCHPYGDEADLSDYEVNWPTSDYSRLSELLFSPRRRRAQVRFLEPSEDGENFIDPIVRVRVHAHWGEAWRRIKSRSAVLLILTMALGKTRDVLQLRSVWRDAYSAVSRARALEVVGYSLPDDDVEIRTLLVAGLRRGTRDAKLIVRNPSPPVHDRFRARVDRRAESIYIPV